MLDQRHEKDQKYFEAYAVSSLNTTASAEDFGKNLHIAAWRDASGTLMVNWILC